MFSRVHLLSALLVRVRVRGLVQSRGTTTPEPPPVNDGHQRRVGSSGATHNTLAHRRLNFITGLRTEP